MNEDFNYGGPRTFNQNMIFTEINIFRSCGEGSNDIIEENHEVFKVASTSREIFLLSSRHTIYETD